jgi:hypothetical protein
MPPVPLRPYTEWLLMEPQDPDVDTTTWNESASYALLLEALRRHSEIGSFGRTLFSGTKATKNLRWYQYRNLVKQAISNFSAALTVSNRSACLLYYYAMLNFAKAELLEAHPADVTGRIRHGLSFDPTKAKTVSGDSLIVHDGVFKLLYQKRTGRNLPTGTVLPIKRLLGNIPEIGQQIIDAGLGSSKAGGCLHMIATDGHASWPLLVVKDTDISNWGTSSSSIFLSVFEEVDSSPAGFHDMLRDNFAVSRRSPFVGEVYQSRSTAANATPSSIDIDGALRITWGIRDLFGLPTTESIDAFLAPSLYKRDLLIMPPSLCRYAVTFYASSLVRYRPYIFDSERYPEQAYMFDAIARECALPMLIDTFSGLQQHPNFFHAPDALRR